MKTVALPVVVFILLTAGQALSNPPIYADVDIISVLPRGAGSKPFLMSVPAEGRPRREVMDNKSPQPVQVKSAERDPSAKPPQVATADSR